MPLQTIYLFGQEVPTRNPLGSTQFWPKKHVFEFQVSFSSTTFKRNTSLKYRLQLNQIKVLELFKLAISPKACPNFGYASTSKHCNDVLTHFVQIKRKYAVCNCVEFSYRPVVGIPARPKSCAISSPDLHSVFTMHCVIILNADCGGAQLDNMHGALYQYVM